MKYHITTYGCQINKSDSERIAAELEKKKYKPVQNAERADLVVINVCSVRQSAINRIYSKIKNLNKLKNKNSKLKIVLTGCILEKDKLNFANQVDEIWPILGFDIKPRYKPKKQAFVPIMNGCNNFCSYCVVPYTRGREISRPVKDILDEIKYLVKNGYQEIILLGQNVNSYKNVILEEGDFDAKRRRRRPIESRGFTTGFYRSFQSLQNDTKKQINFPQLLKKVCEIDGDFKIKFLTSHPKDMSDELIEVIADNEKIAREIHLPVQSGSNAILKKMNRGYTIGQYKNLIKKIRQKVPRAKISTDIIVGFPNETTKQFQDTVKLMKEVKFYQVYAACYSPRHGTAAAKLKDNIPPLEKKKRKRIVLGLRQPK